MWEAVTGAVLGIYNEENRRHEKAMFDQRWTKADPQERQLMIVEQQAKENRAIEELRHAHAMREARESGDSAKTTRTIYRDAPPTSGLGFATGFILGEILK